MNCPLCGKPHPCVHTRRNASALPQAVTSDPACWFDAADWLASSEAQSRASQEVLRLEAASRVRQHRARRRRHLDVNPSLEFDFPLDSALEIGPTEAVPTIEGDENVDVHGAAISNSFFKIGAAPPAAGKIIRFPLHGPPQVEKFAGDLGAVARQLNSPRIVYAAEPQQMELLPNFPEIRLDEEPESVRLPGDVALRPQPAAIVLRTFSALIDMAVMLLVGGLFIAVFVGMTGGFRWSRLALPCALIVFAGLWYLFQYLFLVYGQGTPGMHAVRVELRTLAGSPPTISARRTRALAATLSALSLGLGFLWAFMDEDTLGWHDRMSETCLGLSDRIIASSRERKSSRDPESPL